MKSIDELKVLREIAKKKLDMRDSDKNYRIVVGMGTCGIAAGAKIVLNTMIQESTNRDYSCIITQSGCAGTCSLEPIVDIYDKSNNKFTYINVDKDKALEIMESHILNDCVIYDYILKTGLKG